MKELGSYARGDVLKDCSNVSFEVKQKLVLMVGGSLKWVMKEAGKRHR